MKYLIKVQILKFQIGHIEMADFGFAPLHVGFRQNQPLVK